MRCVHLALLSITLAATPPCLFGCGGESNEPDVKYAEEAVGAQPDKNRTTSDVTRKVTVIEDKKVVDNATGKVLKETVEKKPMTITVKKTENTAVDVQQGEAQTTVNGRPTKPSNK